MSAAWEREPVPAEIGDMISEPTATASVAIEAEQGLLGTVIFDGEAFHYADELAPEHFFEPLHQRLWAAITARIGRGEILDPSALIQQFALDPAMQTLGGVAYLAMLVDKAPGTFVVRGLATTIRDAFVRRELVTICQGATQEAHSGERPAGDVLQSTEAAVFKLGEGGKQAGGFQGIGTGLDAAVERLAAAMEHKGDVSGLTTGLLDLDAKLGGLHPSDLVIVAGRPSMGKTALAVNIGFNASRTGARVGVFSLEMAGEQLAARLLAEVSGVSGDRMRRGDLKPEDYYRVREARDEIAELPLRIDDTGGLAISKLTARARRLKRTHGLDLLIVDYLQLITVPDMRGAGRVAEITIITQALKALAKELNIPVVALSQLSRAVEQREDKRPQLSDLRESGSIEQDADVVMFVYREEYYLGRAEPKQGTPQHLSWTDDLTRASGKAECIIGKQRHGPIGTVHLAFNADLTRFGNLAREGGWADRAHHEPRYPALEHA